MRFHVDPRPIRYLVVEGWVLFSTCRRRESPNRSSKTGRASDSTSPPISDIVTRPLAGLLRHRDALSLKRDHDVKHQTGIEEGAAECLWYPLLLSAHRKARTRRTLPETVAARRMSSGGLARPDPLKDLPNFHAYARLINRDVPTSPIHLVLPFPAMPMDDRSDQLIRNSRTRFGRDRLSVEANIVRMLT